MNIAVIISLMAFQIILGLVALNNWYLLKKSWQREREAQETYDQMSASYKDLVESLNRIIEIQKETIESLKVQINFYEATH